MPNDPEDSPDIYSANRVRHLSRREVVNLAAIHGMPNDRELFVESSVGSFADGRTLEVSLYLKHKDESATMVYREDYPLAGRATLDFRDVASHDTLLMNCVSNDLYYLAWLAYRMPEMAPGGWVSLFTIARAKELGVTAKRLAERTGMEYVTVGKYLEGRTGLGVAKWEKIAASLGIRLAKTDPVEGGPGSSE